MTELDWTVFTWTRLMDIMDFVFVVWLVVVTIYIFWPVIRKEK